MQLFYQPNFDKNSPILDPDESRHAVKVLRLSEGKEITITDGKGFFFHCKIKQAHQKKTELVLLDTQFTEPSKTYRHVAIAPTKNLDRMEWFVEKAVEIGVDEISFILCHHSERRILKTDRLIKKAISAMKQSMKAYMPKINELEKFDHFLGRQDAEVKFIAYVDFENPTDLSDSIESGKSNLVLIGPEGDFDTNEVTKAERSGFKKVSLGLSRLRTETAGLAAVHLLNVFAK